MLDIANELFGYADGMIMSGKKDALVNIGGLLCLNDDALVLKVKDALFLREGFHTYGGLAGRDLEATARGLWEGLDEDYLAYRIGHTRYLGERLRELGVPVVWPPSGHAVFIDAGAMLPHIPRHQSPAMSLVVALYLEGGIRAGALGRVSPYADTTATAADAGTEPGPQVVRLAIPRRVYTQAHLDYVARVAGHIASHTEDVRGLQIVPGCEDMHRFEQRFELV
jgi:tryptophanase